MAVTFNDLVTRVRQQLLGYAKDQEAVSYLTVAMLSTDTAFTADGDTVTSLSRGLVEIDDELILVKKFDATSGTVTVMGNTNGRGREGTTAASHAQNALITTSPAFPRARIKEAVNDTIRTLYPSLVVFGTTEITKSAPVFEYELPAEAKDVWYVTGRVVGPEKIWQPLPNWRYNPKANPMDFPSGKSIQVFDYVTPGQKIRVVYAKEPAVLVNGSDDFAATSGYAEGVADIVVWGACARLLPAYDAGRLQQQAIESTERANLVPTTSALKTAQFYLGLYQQRLDEERAQMFGEVPNVAFFQGS